MLLVITSYANLEAAIGLDGSVVGVGGAAPEEPGAGAFNQQDGQCYEQCSLHLRRCLKK